MRFPNRSLHAMVLGMMIIIIIISILSLHTYTPEPGEAHTHDANIIEKQTWINLKYTYLIISLDLEQCPIQIEFSRPENNWKRSPVFSNHLSLHRKIHVPGIKKKVK